ncbi:hypothetical protein [Leekyejoonella antrihumi]|uniref:Uncharacterized protein n=1 Tax=Leekyejoonella antrihumi TaxID=1660198 RepID=A0A563DUM5_9MICO|nr:hypothetical protein [Leekyejoonella antrihumi]TWP33879.1 hypothetical protein FGL98_19385 [Leekyejoonella antrihumi]
MSDVPVSTTPDADDFRALAQSSPWLFTTLHFTHANYSRGGVETEPVEAWLDRASGRVTVRGVDGVDVAEGVPYGGSPAALHAVAEGDSCESPSDADQLGPTGPVRRPDGLVAERPNGWHFEHGDPMWRDYQWTAMLDPLELHHGVQIDDVAATTRGGRETWSATCRPLMGAGEDWDGGYDPRCGCCPLLDSTASRTLEYGADDPLTLDTELPTAYLVHLDVQTAVVVEVRALDGRGGLVLRNDIDAVDQPLDAPQPRRRR